MFKKGFSTAEILIVLVIVGVIAVAMITTIRPNDKMYGKLCYKAYDILNTAVYNIKQDAADYNEDLYNKANTTASEVNEDNLKTFPEDPILFCKDLADRSSGYINTSYTNCNNIYNYGETFVDAKKKIAVDPTFVASNGMRFYMVLLGDIGDSEHNKWVMIWVDLNGSKLPNSTEVTENKKPDLVPFFINLKEPVVVPGGVAAYDGTYLMAKIIYSTPDLEKSESAPMTMISAKYGAFAGLEWTKDPMSFLDAEILDEIQPMNGLYDYSTAVDPNCFADQSIAPLLHSYIYPLCTIKIIENK